MYPSKLYVDENFQTSVNLVSRDRKTNELVLNNEALNLIRGLDGKIAVCVCIGHYKTGKSFLLNSIFKYLTNSPYNLFSIGHEESKMHTKGCWINREIPILKSDDKKQKVYLLFVDTQGIDVNSINDEWDTRLFVFNYLISSLFIYNAKRKLKLEDLKRLQLIKHLESILSFTSTSTRSENKTKLKNESPEFFSILRDSSNKKTTNELMENFLRMELNDKSNILTDIYLKSTTALKESLKNDEIRKTLLNLFKSFECFNLPEPVNYETINNLNREDNLKLLDQIKFDDLSDSFKNRFDKLGESLKEKLKPKCINGTYLNGFKLAEFIKLIVNLINSNRTVSLHDTLIAAVNRDANYTLDKCKESYINEMNQFKLNFPVGESNLEEKDHELAKECLIKLHKALEFNPAILNEFKDKFYVIRNQKFKELWQANKINQTNISNESKLREKALKIWLNSYKFRLDNLNKIDDFESLLDEFKVNFEKKISNNLSDFFWDEFDRFIKIDKIKNRLREKPKLKSSISKANESNDESSDISNQYDDEFIYEKNELISVGSFMSDGKEIFGDSKQGYYYLSQDDNKVYVNESHIKFK